MSIRPTGYPGWASGVSGLAVEPSALQKAIGWQVSQAPPAAYMNWLNGLAYSWIKYLDDESTLRTVIEDDFCRATQPGALVYGYGFTPLWMPSPSAARIYAGIYFGDGALGMAELSNVGFFGQSAFGSGIHQLLTDIGAGSGSRNFKMEFVAQAAPSSGTSSEFGIPQVLAFYSTGASAWGFQFRPSGAAATQVNFSGYYPTGFCKLSAQRDGSVMNVSINDTLLASMPGAPIDGATSYGFGAKNYWNARLSTVVSYMDRISLKVSR